VILIEFNTLLRKFSISQREKKVDNYKLKNKIMAKYMDAEDIQSFLQEGLEEEGTVEKAFDYLLENEVRDLFEMNVWDEPEFTTLDIPFQGDVYTIEIKDDGCCEATNEHRILYWKWKLTKKC